MKRECDKLTIFRISNVRIILLAKVPISLRIEFFQHIGTLHAVPKEEDCLGLILSLNSKTSLLKSPFILSWTTFFLTVKLLQQQDI